MVNQRATARGALAIGALGVVFGDIGTSPLYTIQTVFNPADPHPIAVSRESIFGVVSLIFWSVTIIVTVTYVLLVMRADNDGEGGIMALITLIRRRGMPGSRRAKVALAALGIFGASLFFGDSIITPAISVLSAIEGVKVAAPSVADLVVPITAAIIVVLFLLQRLGTGAVGRLFGPVMAIWFVAIAVCGVRGGAALLTVDLLFFAANLTKLVHGAWLPLLIAVAVFTTLSYFLSTIALRRGSTPGVSRWRKRLFLATSRITADAADYFQLPRERTVIMGSRIEL